MSAAGLGRLFAAKMELGYRLAADFSRANLPFDVSRSAVFYQAKVRTLRQRGMR